MSTTSALDEVDEYVEALLGEAGASAPAAMPPSDPANGAGLGVFPGATASEPLPPFHATPGPAPIQGKAEMTAPQRSTSATPPAPQATAGAAAMPLPSLQSSHRWLRVAVKGDSYALELLCVQEVVRVTPIVAMRGASRAVLGVMNLRGRIVPVFDLGLWLGTPCVEPDEHSRIVVVERDDELIGVLVTQVEDVVTLGPSRIEPPLPGSACGPIIGVARVGARPTVLLDAAALFANAPGN